MPMYLVRLNGHRVVKMHNIAPQSETKVIQNLDLCRHGGPHFDMVFTIREPHWPTQGSFQKPSKQNKTFTKYNKSANVADVCHKLLPGGRRN